MPTIAEKNKKAPLHVRKRHGHHHHHGKHYRKVYLPYLPLVVIVLAIIFFGGWKPPQKKGVLAYATDVSLNSLLESTNKQRTAAKKTPLKLNEQLNLAAQNKANDMAARNYWAHNTPDGREPWIFFEQAGYRYQKAGENLAYGFTTAPDVVIGWMNSPGHRANLLNDAYQEVGFGFANVPNFNSSGPQTIIVAEYAQPLSAAQPSSDPNSVPLPVITASQPSHKSAGEVASATQVTRIQLLTKGKAPWAVFAIGLLSGISLVLVLTRHGLALRHVLRDGERFVAHHPLLDVTLISFVVLCAVLSKTAGVIG